MRISSGASEARGRGVLLALALTIATGLVLFASACGGSSTEGVAQVDSTETETTSTGSGSSRSSRSGDPFAFAACMRRNGVPDFADPDSEGRFRLEEGSGSGMDPESRQFNAAARACQKFDPQGGEATSPAELAERREQSLTFTRCMRSHGVAKFPDPDPDGSVMLRRNGPIDVEAPQFKSAERACANEIPTLGSGGEAGTP